MKRRKCETVVASKLREALAEPELIKINSAHATRGQYVWAETYKADLLAAKIVRSIDAENVKVYLSDGSCVPWPRQKLAVNPADLRITMEARRKTEGCCAEDFYRNGDRNPDDQ